MNCDDAELLRQYLEHHSEPAFAELVKRHLDLIFSAALRQLNGNTEHAEDVVQQVFADLAWKAPRLARHTSLVGWLYTSTRFAAASLRRAETRRCAREQKAHAMNYEPPVESAPDWEQVLPILDDAMHELNEADREAVLLRYFERLPWVEIGRRLQLAENTARMRVERSLEKLRECLARRGIVSTAAALGTVLANAAVSPAPQPLSASVASRAFGAGPGSTTQSLVWPRSAVRIGLPAVMAMLVVGLGLLWRDKQIASRTAVPPARSTIVPALTEGSNAPTLLPQTAMKTSARSPLELLFVDAQSGAAITNRSVSLRGWERGSELLVGKTVPLSDGRCVSPFDPNFGPGYRILTHIEGYADVMLKWEPGQGEIIPEFYLVRLVRPALIHGRVIDPQGNPVANATVGFGNDAIPGSGNSPETHAIEGAMATTDPLGHWEINCIAPEIVRYLSGSAGHPSFSSSEHISVNLRPELARQLLDGTFTFQLRPPGNALQGIVVDSGGQPIADASLHIGYFAESSSRDGRTGADGKFEMTGCPAGVQLVTADAKGFAPAVRSVDLNTNYAAVTLVLGGGRTLRVRVIDSQGTPVSGARLWYNCFYQLSKETLPQVDYAGRSDAEGRIVWEHAPDLDLPFSCSAEHLMRLDNLTFRPDDREHVITLSPALLVNGSVRDADTGELLPRFRLGLGWPVPRRDGTTVAKWSALERFHPSFSGGTFQHTLTEPVVGGIPNPGYLFRFDAEGYAPFVSRLVHPDEGEVRFEIKLRKSIEIPVTVFIPDGRPAIDAHVGLLNSGTHLTLVPGGFSTMRETALGLRTTDAEGRFVLPDDDAIEQIVIAHEDGFYQCSPAELRQSRSVHLQPWGKIQGEWLIEGLAAAGRELALSFSRDPTRLFQLDYAGYRTTTDERGTFIFPKIPPGQFEVLAWRNDPDPRGGSFGVALIKLQVAAGQSNHLTLTNVVKFPH